MDQRTIITELCQFNQDELFYKEYYEKKRDRITFTAYLNALDRAEIQERALYLPELMGNDLPECLEENFLFHLDKDTDVVLRKHNRYTPGFFHEHTFFEMIYVLAGSCKNTVLVEELTLQAGDICLVAPHTSHSIEAFSDDSLILNIAVKASTFHDIFYKMLYGYNVLSDFFMSSFYSNQTLPYILFSTGGDPRIKDMVIPMLEEQITADEYSGRMLSGQLILLFTLLARHHMKHARLSPANRSYDKNHFPFLHYMQEHYKTVTLASLAEHFHYSMPYCSKRIKDSFGCTFSVLLQQIRLKKAKMLLETSTLSISSISVESGYDNPEHFMRLFKKQYGLTPTQYRNTFFL